MNSQSIFIVLILLLISPLYCMAQSQEELWEMAKNGDHFIMMRHTLAPGIGDPSDFKIKNCATQRNLNEAGKQQAKAIGDSLKKHGIQSAKVYSSQWCRCLETAELLNLGPVQELESLNSFFRNLSSKDQQMDSLRKWLRGHEIDSLLILVTHQVNITGFTGVFPASGEMVLIENGADGEFTTKGTLNINP